jgi:hypothetical protein
MKASCQSLTSQLIKVSGDFLKKYQDFRADAAKVFVNTIIPGKEGSGKELDKLIDAAFQLQTDLMNAYDKVSGEGSWKIGARHILIPTKKVTGSLIATERTFIIPESPFDKVIVTIKKTDGKAGADIAVCAKYSSGEDFNKKEKSIEKGDDTIGEEARFVLADMDGKITTIHLVHTGLLTNKFAYTVEVEGEFNEAEMEKIGKSAGAKAVA